MLIATLQINPKAIVARMSDATSSLRRRSGIGTKGMRAASKLGFATVLQSHLEAVGAAHELPVVVCGSV